MREGGVHLCCALAAGPIGSVVATAASLPLALHIAARSIAGGDRHMEDLVASGVVSVALFMFIVSLPFTFVSALLIGAALTWRFRDWIRARPGLAILVYAAIGAIAGLGVAILFVGFDEFMPFGGIYGATTGGAFALMLWLTRVPKPKSPPLETIFE